jgi:hypothetical protein
MMVSSACALRRSLGKMWIKAVMSFLGCSCACACLLGMDFSESYYPFTFLLNLQSDLADLTLCWVKSL